MKTRTIRRKLYRNLVDYGPVTVAAKSARYLLHSFYQYTEYRVYGMDVQAADFPEDEDGRFSWRFLTPGDAVAIQQVETQSEWLRGRLATRLRNGSVCMAAMVEDRVVAFNLVSFGEVVIPLVHLRWGFQSSEAWSEQISTFRDWRRQGLASQLRCRVARELRDRGYTWFYGGTLPQHHAALQLANRVGFADLGRIHYRRAGNRKSWSFKENPDANCRAHPQPFDSLGLLSADELSI